MSEARDNKPVTYEVNGEEVKLNMNIVRMNLTSGNESVSDQEVVNFMMMSKYNKLNPFLKEVYLIKFKGKPAQMIVSKEAFMKRASANENYDGFEAGIVVERKGEIVDLVGTIKLSSDKLIGGWAKAYRKDQSHPVVARISLSEFSKGQSTWNSMPATMIRKTALVNALREAFPQNLGAMYTEEEQQEARDITPEPKQSSRLSSVTHEAEVTQPLREGKPAYDVEAEKAKNREALNHVNKQPKQTAMFDEMADVSGEVSQSNGFDEIEDGSSAF